MKRKITSDAVEHYVLEEDANHRIFDSVGYQYYKQHSNTTNFIFKCACSSSKNCQATIRVDKVAATNTDNETVYGELRSPHICTPHRKQITLPRKQLSRKRLFELEQTASTSHFQSDVSFLPGNSPTLQCFSQLINKLQSTSVSMEIERILKQNTNLTYFVTVKEIFSKRNEVDTRQIESLDPNVKSSFRSRFFCCFYDEKLFFTIISQEYADRKQIHLEYLDSADVTDLNEIDRRLLHKNIVLAYFASCANRGFKEVHFEICPSSITNEFVFYKRPANQSENDFAILLGWYRKIVELGQKMHIINNMQSLQEHLKLVSPKIKKISDLPIFEGHNLIYKLREFCSVELTRHSATTPLHLFGDQALKQLRTEIKHRGEAFAVIQLIPKHDSIDLPENTTIDIDTDISSRELLFNFFSRRDLRFSNSLEAKQSTLRLLQFIVKSIDL